jgi:hypothetical protein
MSIKNLRDHAVAFKAVSEFVTDVVLAAGAITAAGTVDACKAVTADATKIYDEHIAKKCSLELK